MRSVLLVLLAALLLATDSDYQPFDARAMLGVTMTPPSPAAQAANGTEPDVGVEVQRIYPGSTAERMGLQPGDLIIAVNGSPVSSMTDLRNEIALAGVGGQATVEILRQGRRQRLTETLDAWPPHIPFEPIDDAAERRFREWQARRHERTQQAVNELRRRVEDLERRLAPPPAEAAPLSLGAALAQPASRALRALPPFRLRWQVELAQRGTPAAADGRLRWQARCLLGAPPPQVF
ncbi:MAG: PDZ domain-containing protein [Planctomycetota bacterium]|nr:PDZ domain-containing protein [Planctomycetota bacterium]